MSNRHKRTPLYSVITKAGMKGVYWEDLQPKMKDAPEVKKLKARFLELLEGLYNTLPSRQDSNTLAQLADSATGATMEQLIELTAQLPEHLRPFMRTPAALMALAMRTRVNACTQAYGHSLS